MDTPADNLNTGTDAAGTTGEVMLQVTDAPEPTAPDPAKPDAATPPAAPDPAKPADPAQPDPAKPADAPAPTDPPAADAAVQVTPEAMAVEPKPHDVLAPLFENYETPEAGVAAAMESLDKLYDPKSGTGYDQTAYFTLANALYHRHAEWYKERALTEAGIPKEKIGQFTDWVKKGGDLPAPYQPATFPEPDAEGLVVVDGIQFDVNDPTGKALYNNAKRLFELEEGKRQQDAAKAEAEEKTRKDAEAAAQTKIQTEREGRLDGFVKERNTFLDTQIAEATKDYGSPLLQGVAYTLVSKLMDFAFQEDGPPAMLANVPQFKAAFEHVKQLSALANRAAPHIINGDGRAAELGKAADAITKNLIAAALSDFNKMILRTNQAERASLAGRPNIPDAPVVTAGTKGGTDDGKPKTEAEIFNNLQKNIAAQFGG